MFGSVILDVAMGVVFVYVLLGLVSSAVNELFESWLKNRAGDLERGLRELLQDPNGSGLVKKIYEHPLICGLFAGHYDPQKRKNLPSYMPPRFFALALLDLVPPAANAPVPAAGGGSGAAAAVATGRDQVAKAVQMLFDAAGQDLAKARENVGAWFDNSMERVTGWYKRRAQIMIFCIGLCVALLVNADSIVIADGLATDKSMRDFVAAAALNYVRENPAGPTTTATADARVKDSLQTISSIGLPIGWGRREVETVPGRIPEGWGWLLKLIGCLLTACATSLGASFWFDTLNKIIRVRSSVKPQERAAGATAT